MTRVALRGLLARKLRFFLTALAVLLGTTLIAGTYIFTDSINGGFDKIFTASNRGTDASITAKKTFENSDGTQPTVPAAVLAQVRRSPQVATAAGTVFDLGTILDKKGKRTSTGGAPSFIGSVAAEARFNAVSYPAGRGPRNDAEAAVDTGTADKANFKLGDRICAVAAQPRTCFTLVGITKIAGVGFGGASTLELTLPEAQKMLDKRGRFDQIQAAAKPGVTPQQLADELKGSLPAGVQVRTGEQEAAKQSSDIRSNLGFLKIALFAFAGISLFVGAFLIFNTFSITVAQRAREIALLRTLGASRRQVLQSVVLEGLLVGIVGGALGVALGLATATGLRELFKLFGADLPSGGSVLATRTVVVTVLVGAIVSTLSSLAPAIRATRVAPIEALTESAAPVTKAASRRLTIGALVLLALGVAAMCLGLFAGLSTNAALSAVGAGAAATFIGVALVSPHLVRPLASVIGGPIERATGITGRLARENSMRQAGRTAVTAAALMIGVALVTFASIFAAGAKATIAKAVDQNLRAQLVVQASGGNQPFSPDLLRQAARTDGVTAASGVRFSRAKLGKGTVQVASIEPGSFTRLYDLKLKQGDLGAVRGLGDGQALMSRKYAEAHDLGVGAGLRVVTPSGKRVALKTVAITDDNGFLSTDLVVGEPVMTRDFGETKDAVGFVALRDGVDAKAVKRQLTALVDRQYPGTEVLTDAEFKSDVAGQVDQLLMLIYALLALSIIVSLFGIVNTLVLSVTERTRELGMLRAIGTSRKQVKRMIRWEAVITALIGSVLGAVVGVILAVLFTRPLEDFTLSIPLGTLLTVLVLGAVAGVLAAILPARRAARMNVLDALAYE